VASRVASTMRVLYDDFPDLRRRVRREAERVVDRSAKRVAAAAKAKTPPRVDTGEMLNGWRVEETSATERAVTNAADHHIFNELGTAHMAPHPMLIPAAAEERSRFEAELGKVLD
jgi:HK97 gp10 family phage protein